MVSKTTYLSAASPLARKAQPAPEESLVILLPSCRPNGMISCSPRRRRLCRFRESAHPPPRSEPGGLFDPECRLPGRGTEESGIIPTASRRHSDSDPPPTELNVPIWDNQRALRSPSIPLVPCLSSHCRPNGVCGWKRRNLLEWSGRRHPCRLPPLLRLTAQPAPEESSVILLANLSTKRNDFLLTSSRSEQEPRFPPRSERWPFDSRCRLQGGGTCESGYIAGCRLPDFEDNMLLLVASGPIAG